MQRVVDRVRVACRAGARSRRSARRTRRAPGRRDPRRRRSAAGGRTSSRSGSRSRSRSRGRTATCAARRARRDLVVERIPLQQRVERDRRMRRGPLHVRHAAAGRHVRSGELLRGRGSRGFVDRGDASHAEILWLACATRVRVRGLPHRGRATRGRGAAVLRRATRSRDTPSPCMSRAIRPGRSRPCASWSAPSARLARAPEPARRLRRAHARGPCRRRRPGPARPAARRPAGRRPARRRSRDAHRPPGRVRGRRPGGGGRRAAAADAERIWVDGAGDAHLDGLDARIGPGRSRRGLLVGSLAGWSAR